MLLNLAAVGTVPCLPRAEAGILDLPSPEFVYSGDGALLNSLKISNS